MTYWKGVIMLNEGIMGRFADLKNNVQHLLHKFSDARKSKQGKSVSPDDIQIENYQYESHRMDDLPLTIIKDPGPGVKYSYTENSEFARDAEKTQAVGIDSFGEEDTFTPEEASDHQDYRNRKHVSDLSDRYHTGGLEGHH